MFPKQNSSRGGDSPGRGGKYKPNRFGGRGKYEPNRLPGGGGKYMAEKGIYQSQSYLFLKA